MARTALCFSVILALSLAGAALPEERGERIGARQFFADAGANPLVIEVSAPDVLVFDAAGGEFVLDGRALELRADVVELRGAVVLRSHASASSADAPTDAAEGAAGATGRPGLSAAEMTLDIGELRPLAGATWQVVNEGTDGGLGGRGGLGLAGAAGDAGRPRRCGRHARGPGDGRPGDRGGRGGAGGAGGTGGAGADLLISPNLCRGDSSEALTFSTRGGRGGAGGEGGAAGPGGAGGRGGFAAWCGGPGTEGPQGAPGEAGQNGPSGRHGESGRLLLLDGGSCST